MNRRIALVTAIAAAALSVAAPAQAASSSTPPAARVRCDEGRWPATVQGQPRSFKVGGAAGYYIWHDANGWHLRTTTPSAEGHSFAGQITASDNIQVMNVFKNEPADEVKLEGRTISFRFDTHNHVDGIDFKVGCTNSVRFALAAEGRKWPAKRIKLGATGTARSNPFTITRR